MEVYDRIIFNLQINQNFVRIRKAAAAFVAAEQRASVVSLTIDGYDEDPRELWEIPEVTLYLRRWHRLAKQHGAVFTTVDTETRGLLLLALGRAEARPNADKTFAIFIWDDGRL